jgi:adenylosuccinate synthase
LDLLKGIGPTSWNRREETGLRVGDLLEDDFDLKYNELKEKHLKMLHQLPFDLNAMEWDDYQAYNSSKTRSLIANILIKA